MSHSGGKDNICFINLQQNIVFMVKHIILWTLNPELSIEEKQNVKVGIKEGLEGLVGKVPGLIDVIVHIGGRLPSSTADLMLDCTLESEEALKVKAIIEEQMESLRRSIYEGAGFACPHKSSAY